MESLREFEHIEHVRLTEADMLREMAGRIVDQARDAAQSAGATRIETAIQDGDPATRIVEYSRNEGVDLIVLGRRGLGGIAGLLLGSVSQKVSHVAPCACLLAPEA